MRKVFDLMPLLSYGLQVTTYNINDVIIYVYGQVKSELPSTFKAFRFQQHRWSCGPANLFRKMVMEIIRNKVSSPSV